MSTQIYLIEKHSRNAIAKLERIFTAIKSGLRILLISDQDGTIHDLITWKVLESKLPENAQHKCLEIDKKYQEKHLKGHLKSDDEAKWVKEKIDVFRDCQVSQKIIQSAIQGLNPRDNSHELIKIFDQKNTYIISMGLEYLIKEFLKANSLESVNVFSNKISFRDSFVYKLDTNSIVIPAVKGKILINIARRENIPLEQIIVIGDSKGDERMFRPETLNILVGTNGYQIKNVDLCLRSDSFKPLVELFTRCDITDTKFFRKKIQVY